MKTYTLLIDNTYLVTLNVTEIFAENLPDVIYKPMCYLQRDTEGTPPQFTMYASVVVPKESDVYVFGVTPVNATNYVTVYIKEFKESKSNKLLWMEFLGIPQPIGFKVSSIQLNITNKHPQNGTANNGGPVGWPVEGQGKTAVDYEDADEPTP